MTHDIERAGSGPGGPGCRSCLPPTSKALLCPCSEPHPAAHTCEQQRGQEHWGEVTGCCLRATPALELPGRAGRPGLPVPAVLPLRPSHSTLWGFGVLSDFIVRQLLRVTLESEVTGDMASVCL